MHHDELLAEGLYDPTVDDPSRLPLLQRCLDIGLTVDEIREAGDDLIDLAVQRLLAGGEESFTIAEVADRAGVPLLRAEQIARASGIDRPGLAERYYSERDVGLISTVGLAFDVLGEEATLQLIRVGAAAVARLGDAAMSTFLTSVGARASRDDSGLELIDANQATIEMLPRFGDVLIQMLTHYLRQAYRPRSEVSVNSVLGQGVDTRELAMGFADLVGSATVTDRKSLADLNIALDIFERTATDIITAGGGRVVKFIGDEVMFRADSADIACAVAVDLVEFVRTDRALPPLRAGLALGEVLSREGDFYGPVVNLASRITKFAPLHGVVATADMTDALAAPSDFTIHRLGAIEMRGISEPVELATLSRPE